MKQFTIALIVLILSIVSSVLINVFQPFGPVSNRVQNWIEWFGYGFVLIWLLLPNKTKSKTNNKSFVIIFIIGLLAFGTSCNNVRSGQYNTPVPQKLKKSRVKNMNTGVIQVKYIDSLFIDGDMIKLDSALYVVLSNTN